MRIPLRSKLTLSARNVLGTLARPVNLLTALFIGFLMLSVIIWWLNLDLMGYIMFQAPLTLGGKLQFLLYSYGGLFTSYDSLLSISLLLLSFLLGVNALLLWRALKQRAAGLKTARLGGLAATLGVLGGGCASCGTSLIGPILASFGATSAAAQSAGMFFNFLGAGLLLYSIYRVGLVLPASQRR